MTTIAWDGKILAADGRVTDSNGRIITNKYEKLFRIDHLLGATPYRNDELLFIGMSGKVSEFEKIYFNKFLFSRISS